MITAKAADRYGPPLDLFPGTSFGSRGGENSESRAKLIYTSGSTGKPKGVMLRHRGICNYLTPYPGNTIMRNIRERTTAYLSVTTVSFDMSFKEHTAALCNGKTLVFAAEDEMNDPRALAALMKQHHIDCVNATPSRLQQYMEYAPFRAALGDCRMIMSGGEACPMALRDELKKHLTHYMMYLFSKINIYWLWAAFPVSRAVTIAITALILAICKRKRHCDSLLLLEEEAGNALDFSIRNTIAEATDAARRAVAFCDENGVDYISSAGLREAIALFRSVTERGSGFSIRRVRPDVADVFTMTGFDRKMDIRGD